MVSLKKYISCKCGATNFFEFNSDMQVEDITVSGRCSSCGTSISVSVTSLLAHNPQSGASGQSQNQQQAAPAETAPVQEAHDEHVDKDTSANVEQAVRDLFR